MTINAPTSVVASPNGADIDLDWAPPTGGAADGYDVRIDGGTPVDVGNVLTYTFVAPGPGSHTLEVRAYSGLSTLILSHSPPAYYRLADATDSSGNGRDGSATSVTFGQTSLNASDTGDAAASFNGSSSRIAVTYGSWMNLSSQFTLWCLLKPAGSPTVADFITRHGPSASQFLLRAESGVPKAYIRHAGNFYGASWTTALTNGTTYSVAGTYDGTTVKVNVNGVFAGLTTTHTGIDSVTASDVSLVIGAGQAAGFSEFANGIIDEAFILPTALSATQLADLHAAATTAGGIDSAWVADTASVAPPSVPTTVSATPDIVSIELTWGVPATGSVSSYEVRIDGGTAVDVGDVLTHTFTGLLTLTEYELEVRAIGPAGESAWVTVYATTGTAPWRVEIVIGDHSWTVDEDDEADPDVPNLLAGMSVGWSAPTRSTWDWSGPPNTDGPFDFPPGTVIEGGWPAQPDPWIAKLGIITDTAVETSDLDVGDKVWVRFYPDGPTEPMLFEFAGRIRELTGQPVGSGRHVTRVVAADYTLDLTEIEVGIELDPLTGLGGWPQGPDNTYQDRWQQAADFAGIPSLDDPPDYPETLQLGTTIGGPGSGTAYSILRSIMQATQSMLSANVDPLTGDLDASHPWVAKIWRPNIADGVSRAYLYGNGLAVDSGDVSSGGVPASLIPIDGIQWARDLISPGPPSFDTSIYGMPLEGGWTANGMKYIGQVSAHVAHWFELPRAMMTLIGISDVATWRNPRGNSWYAGRLSSATLEINDGKWAVGFTLIRTVPDPANTVITYEDAVSWDELPSDLTWDDMADDITWGDMAAITEAD